MRQQIHNKPPKLFGPVLPIFFGVLALIYGWVNLEFNRPSGTLDQTKYATSESVMGGLINTMGIYSNKYGHLPENFQELTNEFIGYLSDLPSSFNYNPKGVVSNSDTIWLITLINPINSNELFLGKPGLKIISVPKKEVTELNLK